MGQYKLSFYFEWQVGLCISYEKKYKITLNIPFVQIVYGLTKHASGIRFFKD